MGERVDYLDDPAAPQANSVVPSANVIVVNDQGGILMIRRTDNGNWAMPGGGMDLGESIADAAVRETREETGISCEISGLVGIYTNPRHVILYTSNGEVRQEFSVVFTARPTGGQLRASSESSEPQWVSPEPYRACRCIRRCASASGTTWTNGPNPTWAEQQATPQHARRWPRSPRRPAPQTASLHDRDRTGRGSQQAGQQAAQSRNQARSSCRSRATPPPATSRRERTPKPAQHQDPGYQPRSGRMNGRRPGSRPARQHLPGGGTVPHPAGGNPSPSTRGRSRCRAATPLLQDHQPVSAPWRPT
jgi:ADP-ribose pyrophosphatase YjhB (NUDIX family)